MIASAMIERAELPMERNNTLSRVSSKIFSIKKRGKVQAGELLRAVNIRRSNHPPAKPGAFNM
jgi:hypothetical protein